jgi:hypothetical protein
MPYPQDEVDQEDEELLRLDLQVAAVNCARFQALHSRLLQTRTRKEAGARPPRQP